MSLLISIYLAVTLIMMSQVEAKTPIQVSSHKSNVKSQKENLKTAKSFKKSKPMKAAKKKNLFREHKLSESSYILIDSREPVTIDPFEADRDPASSLENSDGLSIKLKNKKSNSRRKGS